MWPVFFYHSNHFQFLRATAKGLKCQMQMQLLKYLDSWCRLVFFLSFFYAVSWFPSLHLTLSSCLSPGIEHIGVTHFHHLCWVVCVAVTLCLSKAPAAQRPHCESHNKVFKF